MTENTERLSTALADRYKIERHLGEGGMANVYLAEDLKHHRKVAVKVLRPELAAVLGAERFVKEIETTANLQHPHILPLFDSGEADSFLYYVMPFIDGETLRDKLNRETQLGIDEAVSLTTAIADALDYAHRQNVIHRDIKPENILLHDGRPMVADFGIALAVSAAAGGRMTETGMSLGTPHYMSPEQATAEKDLTSRSDIYSLGCVLYEMLTGEPPHVGGSAQAIIMKIVTDEARPVTELRKSVPPHVAAATAKSLEKLAADRFGSAAKFAEALTNPAFAMPATSVAARAVIRPTGPWDRWGPVAAAVAVASLAVAAWALTRPLPNPPVTRVAVRLADGQELAAEGTFDISADGSIIVYQGPSEEGVSQLWMRRWDALEGTPVREGVEVGRPAISPNGGEVAIAGQGTLRVIPLQGGASRTVATGLVSCCPRWSDDGAWIYFDHLEGGIGRVPSSGGPVEVVMKVDSAGGGFNTWIDVLPGGESLVYEANDAVGPRIEALNMRTGEKRRLADGQYPRYGNGYLLFATPDGLTLMGAPFDLDALEFTSPPVPVAEGVLPPSGGYNYFAVSQTGKLVYSAGSRLPPEYDLVWVSRGGRITSIDGGYTFDPGNNNRGISLSPDGSRVAITTLEDDNYDIWIKELPTGPASRLTFDDAIDVRPRWSPDGAKVMFLSDRGKARNDPSVFAKSATGTGTAELLLDHQLPLWEAVLSPDQTWLLARTGGSTTIAGGRDVWAMRLGTDSTADPLIVTPFDEKAITLSPDGHWLMYESDETGRNEVYLRPFPDIDQGKWQISTEGGVMPRWAHSGREIFYINRNNEMVAAQVDLGSGASPVRSRDVLFPLDPAMLFRQGEQYALYDVGPGDQRFLMLRTVDLQATEPDLILVENWFEELKAKVGN
jgi:serine/threonine-protein kinase